MAKIRILQAISGLDFSWQPGDEIELPGEQASAWADGFRAELVRGEKPETPERAPKPETADAAPAETPEKPARRTRQSKAKSDDKS